MINKDRWLLAVTLAVAGVCAMGGTARAEDAGHWVTSWAASVQPVWEPDFFAPVSVPRGLRDQTMRQIARISVGGDHVRVMISNEYGKLPLAIGSAHVALAGPNGDTQTGSDHALTFAGKSSVVVPPGAPIVSDPLAMHVDPLSSIAVSLYFPEVTPTSTWHNDARQTAYIAAGDETADTTLPSPQPLIARLFLSAIQVDAGPDTRTLVTFGDSITDGDGSTVDANNRWPDVLAERLAQADAHLGVANEGISGARILRDRMGDNALARFDRDVLGQPNVATVVLMMGINDVGWPDTLLVPKGEPAPSAQDVIAGYEQLIARAHAHGLRILGATLTPFEDTFHGTPLFGYYSEDKEAKREVLNDWIREPGHFDGVIDFDKLTRDPANPKHIQAQYDKGDHLHPNPAGYKAMAELIDLKMLDAK